MKALLFLLLASGLAGQVSAPVIGYVRDLKGVVRAVEGVAGAFVLGEPIAEGISTAFFDGKSGCAGTLEFRRGRFEESDRTCEPREMDVVVRNGEIVIGSSGVRLTAPAAIESVEQMGEGWFVLRARERLYAVRTAAGRECIYVLPESVR
jgi:hypothetical protein